MNILLPTAEKIAVILKQRSEKVAVLESSSGGLISAALLAVPGASAYFIGGWVLYTRQSWQALKDYDEKRIFEGTRAATQANALIRARYVRHQLATDWGISETGAAGSTGNKYGDPAGHTCIAVAGAAEHAITVRTGNTDRAANMLAFAAAALDLLLNELSAT